MTNSVPSNSFHSVGSSPYHSPNSMPSYSLLSPSSPFKFQLIPFYPSSIHPVLIYIHVIPFHCKSSSSISSPCPNSFHFIPFHHCSVFLTISICSSNSCQKHFSSIYDVSSPAFHEGSGERGWDPIFALSLERQKQSLWNKMRAISPYGLHRPSWIKNHGQNTWMPNSLHRSPCFGAMWNRGKSLNFEARLLSGQTDKVMHQTNLKTFSGWKQSFISHSWLMALIHWLGALLHGILTAKTQSSLYLEHCPSPWWGWGEHMTTYVLAFKAATQKRYTSLLLTFHCPKEVHS